MPICNTSYSIQKLGMALTMLCLCSSCAVKDYDDELSAFDEDAMKYINLTLTVSANNQSTRAGETPVGGENGDGLETAFHRENDVAGVTVIFYQNENGINATDASAEATPIDFVGYYATTLVSREEQGKTASYKFDEAHYTTGDQKMDAKLNSSKKYHMIVVANANLTSTITVGNASATNGNLKAVRNLVYSSLYTGTGVGTDAKNFVMASENDPTITFDLSTRDAINRKVTYKIDGIRVERLSARIDFSTKYYGTTNANWNPSAYARPGYVYQVWKSTDTTVPTSNDKFVVCGITPFNLSSSNEYLIKRTSINDNYAARSSEVYKYLEDESTTSWVLDVNSTAAKSGSAYPSWISSASQLENLDTQAKIIASTNPNYVELNTTWYSSNKYTDDGTDIVIVGYSKENTIDDNTPLYYYATGIAIEGLYYASGSLTPTPLVYYTYLRHQGEAYPSGKTAYLARVFSDLSKTETISSLGGKDMNYGVVRNNIYRVSINKINEKAEMELSIKVKKWDPFLHEYIYL